MNVISNIPFLNIESIPQLIKDFLEQKIPGFEEQLFNTENIRKIQEQRRQFSDSKREVLSTVLQDQMSKLSLSEAQKKNLASISSPDTFTVTTGHQLNLFSGPVFFVYKILQTIKLADCLNETFPDSHIVPVFWMATEDHDFEEINHFKTETGYYEIHAKSGGPVGRINVENTAFIDEFAEDVKDSIFGTELILMMKKAYAAGNTLAEATRILVNELFSEHGILILDGDDRRLKSQMKSLFKEELRSQNLLNDTRETVDDLTEKYGQVQVNPREINLFYLSETRNRIERNGDAFSVVDSDISFSADDIINELDRHPENFSPNALLRPVYQEVVLPNLAYVGGNAEIMYWLELKNYFKQNEIPYPVLIPRNSVLFVSEKTKEKAAKFNLEVSDFLRNFSTISKDVLMKNNSILDRLNQQQQQLQQQFSGIAEIASETDVTFGNLVKAEETRQLKSFARMKKRLLRAEKIKQQEKLEQLENLFLRIHPGKTWQERQYNFSVFYADLGREWLQNCYREMDVQQSELIIAEV